MTSQLCALCQGFNLVELLKPEHSGRPPRTLHQDSLDTLAESAAAGCRLCGLFHAGVLKWFDGPFNRHRTKEEAFERDRACQDVRRTRFAISAIRQRLDSRHAPFESGYRGLTYVRADSAWSEDGPVFLDVYVDILPTSGGVPFLATRNVEEEPDFDLYRKWIQECSKNHIVCPVSQDRNLPTRLLYVGPKPEDPIHLVQSKGSRGKYVALSHCWGTSDPPRTTTKSSAIFELAIPFHTLPETFQHAVTATRELGFNYLWIDCFCILQDDTEDFQKECAAMQKTFSNAAITICGPGAGSADAGFLWPRPMTIGPECHLDVRDFHTEQTLGRVSLRLAQSSALNPEWSSENKQLDSALAKRGWIVQERLLSSRVLYFGTRQAYFECNTVDCHEGLAYPIPSEISGEIGDNSSVPKDFLLFEDEKELPRIWCDIVAAYTSCNLSEQKDKLPAISGLACRYVERRHDTYLAGIWKTDITNGLVWYRNIHSRQRKSRVSTRLLPPSWTWASCDYEVLFANFFVSGRRDLASTITLESASTNTIGLDPFGEVNSGHLHITAHQKEAILQRDVDSEHGFYYIYPQWEDGETRAIGQCYMDSVWESAESENDDDDDIAEEVPVTCVMLGIHVKTEEIRASGDTFVALVLQHVPDRQSDVYKRIGLLDTFFVDPDTFIVTEDTGNFLSREESLLWIRNGERKSVTII